jgi:hypothetical protein
MSTRMCHSGYEENKKVYTFEHTDINGTPFPKLYYCVVQRRGSQAVCISMHTVGFYPNGEPHMIYISHSERRRKALRIIIKEVLETFRESYEFKYARN